MGRGRISFWYHYQRNKRNQISWWIMNINQRETIVGGIFRGQVEAGPALSCKSWPAIRMMQELRNIWKSRCSVGIINGSTDSFRAFLVSTICIFLEQLNIQVLPAKVSQPIFCPKRGGQEMIFTSLSGFPGHPSSPVGFSVVTRLSPRAFKSNHRCEVVNYMSISWATWSH